MRNSLWLLAGALLLISCENEPRFTPVELYELAKQEDPQAEPVLGDLAETAKNLCVEFRYSESCQKVIRASVQNLQIIFVEFPNQKLARLEALRIDQYYARNWVIDDVKGEPGLERFVKKVYQAKNPQKGYQNEL